jgi:hypothetical protein
MINQCSATTIAELVAHRAEILLSRALSDPTEEATTVLDQLKDVTERYRAETEEAAEAARKFRTDMEGTMSIIAAALLKSKQTVDQATLLQTENARAPVHLPTFPLTQVNTPDDRTYATIIRDAPPHASPTLLARADARDRQILITTAGSTSLSDMSEKELVAKANMTINLMGMASADRPDPEHDMFVSAQKLQRGDILYVIRTGQGAAWLRRVGVREAFISNFGSPVLIQKRVHRLVIENVPVSFNPTMLEILAIQNDIPPDTISNARWIKREANRKPGQTTAFLSLDVNTPNAFNSIVRQGIRIEGRQCRARKQLQEPRRCLKCQGFGNNHYAAECKLQDTCAMCAGNHTTADCTRDEEQGLFCVNCNTPGHGAADRNCQTFRRYAEKLNARIPENLYKYCPTASDPLSWERTDTTPMTTVTTEMEWSIAGRDGKAQRRFVAPPRDHGWTVNHAPLGKGRGLRATAERAGMPNPAERGVQAGTAGALNLPAQNVPHAGTQSQLTDFGGWGDPSAPWSERDERLPAVPATPDSSNSNVGVHV